MPILNCYVDKQTLDSLTYAAAQLGRTVIDLAESSIAEAALDYDRSTFNSEYQPDLSIRTRPDPRQR